VQVVLCHDCLPEVPQRLGLHQLRTRILPLKQPVLCMQSKQLHYLSFGLNLLALLIRILLDRQQHLRGVLSYGPMPVLPQWDLLQRLRIQVLLE
jgi:hypothetical protein